MKSCLAVPFRYALAANSTATTALAALPALSAEPSGAGYFDLARADFVAGATAGPINERIPAYLQLLPFAECANDESWAIRVTGYTPTIPTAGLVLTTAIYVPQLLCHLTVIAATGMTIAQHTAASLFCDTITVTKGPADNAEWGSVVSPADGVSPAHYIVNTKGCRYIRFEFDRDITGTATSVNCLWRPVEF